LYASHLYCSDPRVVFPTLPGIVLSSGRMLGTTHPMAKCEITENLNSQPHCHENFKSCVYGCFLFRLYSFINDCVIVISLMP